MAKKSIIRRIGSNMPAAVTGLMLRHMIGIANIDTGPAKPPLEIPNTIIPIEAVR